MKIIIIQTKLNGNWNLSRPCHPLLRSPSKREDGSLPASQVKKSRLVCRRRWGTHTDRHSMHAHVSTEGRWDGSHEHWELQSPPIFHRGTEGPDLYPPVLHQLVRTTKYRELSITTLKWNTTWTTLHTQLTLMYYDELHTSQRQFLIGI